MPLLSRLNQLSIVWSCAALSAGVVAPQEQRAVAHPAPFWIFDNVGYVGLDWVSCYVIKTSEGLVLVDALYGAHTEHALAGLRTLGLDPASIRYVLVTHAHWDHAGGATMLQDRYGARVAMTEADWRLASEPPVQPDWAFPPPARDLVVRDGETLTLGDTTLHLYVTPGHTEGVLSLELAVADGARSIAVNLPNHPGHGRRVGARRAAALAPAG